MDSLTKLNIESMINEVESLKEESKYCDDEDREIIAGDIRNLKKRIAETYANENKYNNMNKNADYYRKRHEKKITESKRLNEFLDDDEILFYNDDLDDTFIDNGSEFRWSENGLTYQECINGTCWSVREAVDVDTGEVVYFVVDDDSGEIDWDCGTPEEAIDFVQAKYDDLEDDDYYDFDDIDEDEYYAYFTREDEAYDYRSKNSSKPFTVSYAKGEYVGTCIVTAKSKNDAENKFYNRLGEYGYKVISVRNGNLMPEAQSLGMLADEVMYDDYDDYDELDLDYEATNVGSIGQHKRSSIDLINPDDEDMSRFDVDDDDSDDFELLVEDGDTEEVNDDDFVELDLVDDIETTTTDTEDDTTGDTTDTADTDDSDELELDSDTVDSNIDGRDSTSPMDNSKSKRTGTNKIDI